MPTSFAAAKRYDPRFEPPAILEFQPGDRLPVELAFSDDMFGLEPSPPNLALVAREHCFIRVDQNGLRVSRDGHDFDREPKEPGSFFVGFTNDSDGAPHFSVRVRTPRSE